MAAHADPVVISVAPNGARRTKADHPRIPITADELAREARECCNGGATLLHLHVRDELGRHSLDAGRYREAIAAVRAAVGEDMIVQITTESAGCYGPADQMDVVRTVRPEAASVGLSEVLRDGEAAAASFFNWAVDAGVAVQHILYSSADAQRLIDLVDRKLVAEPAQSLFVLGRYAEPSSSSLDLLGFLRSWPSEWKWTVCGFGAMEFGCAAAAAGLGGHVRVGFENNLQSHEGKVAGSNAENVRVAAQLAQLVGRGVADVACAVKLFGVRR